MQHKVADESLEGNADVHRVLCMREHLKAPAELLMLLRTLIANDHSQQVSDESVSKENREDCGYGVRCGARVHCLFVRVYNMPAFVI